MPKQDVLPLESSCSRWLRAAARVIVTALMKQERGNMLDLVSAVQTMTYL
jgi:hypothetical protein